MRDSQQFSAPEELLEQGAADRHLRVLPEPEWPYQRSSTPPPRRDSSLDLRPSAPPPAPDSDAPGSGRYRQGLPRPIPAYVDVATVRALYEQYMRVVGPVAKAVFEMELRAMRRLPSTLSEHECALLAERLTARIPIASARARFLTATHDLLR